MLTGGPGGADRVDGGAGGGAARHAGHQLHRAVHQDQVARRQRGLEWGGENIVE